MDWLDHCCCLLKVNDWLERLVDEKGEDLYRLKGVISVNESTGRFVFQVSQSIIFLTIYLNEFDAIISPGILLISLVRFCHL
jgi:G3E family GTPase